jgi:hypothetical protein
MSGLDMSVLFRDKRLLDPNGVIRRRVPITLANHGVATPGTPVDVPIPGVVGPASQADLEVLPEGTRLSDSLEVFTSGDLKMGDAVRYGGDSFTIMHFEDWSARGYVRAVAIRLKPGAST